MNKTDKPLARVTRKKVEETQITNVKNERGDITTDCIAIKRIIREYLNNFISRNSIT